MSDEDEKVRAFQLERGLGMIRDCMTEDGVRPDTVGIAYYLTGKMAGDVAAKVKRGTFAPLDSADAALAMIGEFAAGQQLTPAEMVAAFEIGVNALHGYLDEFHPDDHGNSRFPADPGQGRAAA